MLDMMLQHIPKQTPIILPKWERMITDIQNRQNLLNMSDQFNRCAYLMEPRVRGFLEQIIDDVRTKPFHKKVFFNSLFSQTTSELIIPVMNKDPLMSLPLMNYELGVWTDIKPIKVIYYDSLELVSSLVVDPRIKCKRDVPSIGIVTIDVISLILKFVNYLDNMEIRTLDYDMLRTFLKEEVFIHLHEDMIEVWLLNVIDALLDCETEEEINQLEESFRSNSLLFADFHNYFMELIKKVKDLKSGKIKSFQLLQSKLLGNRSIIDRSKELVRDLRVRDLRQYYHNQLCIYIQDIKLILKVLQFDGSKFTTKSIKYELMREMRLMMKENYLSQYKSILIRNWMKQELEEINELINLI